MQYHPSGAINVIDSTGDGLQGLYNPDGYIRVLVDDVGGSGLYDSTGALRVTDDSLETSLTGTYNEDGSINAVFVDGTELVGVYSPIGARNYFLQT